MKKVKDREGDLWFEVGEDSWICQDSQEEAEATREEYGSNIGYSLSSLRAEWGPLEDQRTATNDQIGSSDTPPQSGDTVSVKLNDENGSVVVGKFIRIPQDADCDQALIEGDGFLLRVHESRTDIQVIARAKPSKVMDVNDDVWTLVFDGLCEGHWDNPIHGSYTRYEDLESEKGPLSTVERGKEIVGE